MVDEHTARTPPPLMEQLREGWHALGGGDAAGCPGCPVCRLTEQAGRLDPVAAEHLHSAAGHLVQAGREVLAALGRLPGASDPHERSDPRPDLAGDREPDPRPPQPVGRTRIPVETPQHPDPNPDPHADPHLDRHHEQAHEEHP